VAYGEGFRSPQALTLDDGEPAPFTKVRSLDYGARTSFGPNGAYGLRASGFFTKLSDDIAFDPGEGRPTRVGPSARLGAVVYGDIRPMSWLTSALSVTYVHATLTSPPAATLEQPSPPYRSGQLLPYVPPWVARLDARAEHRLTSVRERPLVGHASLGLTVWSKRPLPYGMSTPAVTLLDAGLGATLGPVQLDLDVFNLLDARYASIEVVTASSFNPAAVPSRLPARHLSAGAPRTVLLTLGISL
jgi:iron complex outermembrane recepter protein